MRWFAKVMTLLEERACGNKLTKKVASRPLRAATLQLRHDVVAGLANSLDLRSQLQRSRVFGSDCMERILSVDQRHQLLEAISLLSQYARSRQDVCRIGC